MAVKLVVIYPRPKDVEAFSSRLSGELGEYAVEGEGFSNRPRNPSPRPI